MSRQKFGAGLEVDDIVQMTVVIALSKQIPKALEIIVVDDEADVVEIFGTQMHFDDVVVSMESAAGMRVGQSL